MAHDAASNHELANEKYCGVESPQSQLRTSRPGRPKPSLEFDSMPLAEEAHVGGGNREPDAFTSFKRAKSTDKFAEQRLEPGDKRLGSSVVFQLQRSVSCHRSSLEGTFSERIRVTDLWVRKLHLLADFELKDTSTFENIQCHSEGRLHTLASSPSKRPRTFTNGPFDDTVDDFNLDMLGIQGTATVRPVPQILSGNQCTPSEQNTKGETERASAEYVNLQGSEASVLQDEFQPLLAATPDLDGEQPLTQQLSSRSSTPSSGMLSLEPARAISDDSLTGEQENARPTTDGGWRRPDLGSLAEVFRLVLPLYGFGAAVFRVKYWFQRTNFFCVPLLVLTIYKCLEMIETS
ncbi:hypothetical protein MRX96_033518 [Rhipicephalus microplus]